MVRYLPDRWQAGLTTNGISNIYELYNPFALRPTCRLQGAGRYRRVNGTFYEFIKIQTRRNAMKLSTRGRYGTRLMVELAKNYGKGPVSMSEISKKQDIPVKYLEQIIIPLKKANLVSSIRGPKGGHILARPPDQVNVWELLLLLESKLTFVDCLREENACENAETCVVRPLWSKAYEAIRRLFKETTLKDLLISNPHS